MSPPGPRKVAIITGASQGIGAGLVAGFRASGYAVVGTSRSIRPSDESGYLTVQGDISEAKTAEHVAEQALDRFSRIDALINDAGIFISKPFTDYSPDDYAAISAANLAGFFHITQRAIRQMVDQGGGHIVNITTSIVDRPSSERPSANVEEAADPIWVTGRLQDDGRLVVGRAAADVDDDPAVCERDVRRLTPADRLAAQHLRVEAA
jgi:short-subunit dehydrogenase involved in D-alanine esterification of teichoic acids